jgi:hypothetical protein
MMISLIPGLTSNKETKAGNLDSKETLCEKLSPELQK